MRRDGWEPLVLIVSALVIVVFVAAAFHTYP